MKSPVIVFAVIILIGILALTAGHFLGIAVFFYGGLIITLAGVLMEIIFIITQGQQ